MDTISLFRLGEGARGEMQNIDMGEDPSATAGRTDVYSR